MAAGDLTTLANAKDWIEAPDSASALVQRLISAISTQIQKFLGYQVASSSYSKIFNGHDGGGLTLPDMPVTAVASVNVDGVAIPAASMPTSCGFVFDDRNVYLRGYRFSRGVQNVSIAYTAGYASIPGDIEQGCLDWLNSAWQGMDRDPSLKMRKAGDTAETFDGTTKLGDIIVPMPASVFAALNPYRRVTPV